MKHVVATVLVVLFTSNVAWAQVPPPTAPPPTQTTGADAGTPEKPQTPEIVVIKSPSFFEWKFSTMLGLMSASTIWDVHTTFEVVKKCPSCEETNPFLRALIKAGKPTAYAVFGALEALTVWASYKSRKQGQWHWWIAPAVVTATHIAAGLQNRKLIRDLEKR